MEDWDAWLKYPQHRWVYNKLELSCKLGYVCGPAPMPVPYSGYYCIRPIMNLGGMGAQAQIKYLEQDRLLEIAPAHFWCERFTGTQYSVNFQWQDSEFVPVHTSVGFNQSNNLYRFQNWKQVYDRTFNLPEFIYEFQDVEHINIEFLGDKIIEIHLRWGEDFPEGAEEIIPVYDDSDPNLCKKLEQQGYLWNENYVDAETNIPHARLGFYYK